MNLNENNLKNYVTQKITKVKDLAEKIEEIRKTLSAMEQELENEIDKEIKDLRKMTGINHLINKSSALSRVSNEALNGENNGQN